MPPLNRNSFLANQHRSPLNNAISSVVLSPNPVTTILNGILQKSGVSSSTARRVLSQALDSVLASANPGFFSSSPQRQTADRLSILRNPSNANAYSTSVSPEGVISESQQSTAGQNSIKFPNDLSDQYCFTLQFQKYDRPDPFESSKFNSEVSVRLPIPNELNETYGMQYTDVNMGALGLVVNRAQQALRSGKSIEDTFKGMYGTGSEAAKNIAQDVYASAIPSIVSATVGEEVAGTIGQFAGAIPNPHPSVMFQGIQLRSHNFSWLLVPKNKPESDTIKSIIHTLRTKTLPSFESTSQKNLLDYPYMILPTLTVAGIQDNLYKFKKCVCDNFNVVYSPLGSPAFYGNSGGSPFAVQLSISLREIEYFTAQDLAQTDQEANSFGNNATNAFNSGYAFLKNSLTKDK